MLSRLGGHSIRSYGVNDLAAQSTVTDQDLTPTPKDAESSVATDKQLNDFLTKLVLRVFNSCPLLSGYLFGQYCGKGTIELAFYEPPAAVVTQLVTLFGGCPYETFKFCAKNEPCLGFRLRPRQEDLSDLEDCSSGPETPAAAPENELLEPHQNEAAQ